MNLKRFIKNVLQPTLVVFMFAVVAQAATITVPDDYVKIQWAIDNATTGDTINVKSGTYYENIIVNKQLTLNGINKPVVDGSGNGIIVAVYSSNSSVEGFVLRNGRVGIELLGNDAAIVDNEIYNISGISYYSTPPFEYHGIGVIISSSGNNVSYNSISKITGSYGSGNDVGSYSFGIYVNTSDNKISENKIFDIIGGSNSYHGGSPGFGVYLSSSSNSIISLNNIFNISSGTSGSNGMGGEGTGIYLNASTNNNLLGNNISDIRGENGLTYGKGRSIYLFSSGSNTISSNNIFNNNYDGIYLDSSGNNLIYNNFFKNANNFGFTSSILNNWNITITTGTNVVGGNYIGGNAWANNAGTGFSQTCIDSDSDGLCDSPYTLDNNNVDYLPLAYTGWTPASSIGYSALVATGQNTFVQSSNGTFGLLLKGQSKTINNSVILNNTGDISTRVEARFNDSIGGVYGLVSGTNVLNATNFALGIPSTLVPLNNSGADVQVAVAPPGVTALDARLGVPGVQAAGDYSGTVVLTFSNNV